MEKTVLERVARVIHDLETVRVVRKEDEITFRCSRDSREYKVKIKLCNLATRKVSDDWETIKNCLNDEFQENLKEGELFNEFIYMCTIIIH